MKTRQTKQKKAIYDVLERMNTHLPAEQIFKLVRKKVKNISLATVYRNLETMTDTGLLHEVYVSGFPKWYEIKKHECHGHLFCRDCHCLIDVVDCGLCFVKNRMEKDLKFSGEEIMYLVVGVCDKCKKY